MHIVQAIGQALAKRSICSGRCSGRWSWASASPAWCRRSSRTGAWPGCSATTRRAASRWPRSSASPPAPAPTPPWRWPARIFRKGASFTAAMVFELASTNLVIELGIILVVLMGWQFAAAEYRRAASSWSSSSPLIFRLTLTPRLVARPASTPSGRAGAHGGPRRDGHERRGRRLASPRLFSGRGFTAVSHYFVMDWASVWTDIVVRLPDRRRARRLGARHASGRASS